MQLVRMNEIDSVCQKPRVKCLSVLRYSSLDDIINLPHPRFLFNLRLEVKGHQMRYAVYVNVGWEVPTKCTALAIVKILFFIIANTIIL